MNKWFRWQGALGFVAVVGLTLSIGWFFLDNWIHYAIESSGEELMGAKVELDQVNTTLSPLGLELINLQIADPEEPFQNIVQIGSIRSHVDVLYLLMGQAIFNEAEILDVRFATERKTSGVMPSKKIISESSEAASVVDDVLKEVGVEPPSVDSILKKETLTTQIKSEALEELFKQCEKMVDEAKDSVPDKKQLKQYEIRLHSIIKGKIKNIADFKQRKRQLKQLKTELRSIKKQIENSKVKLLACRSNFNKELKALRKAPKEDLKRLKDKYRFSEQGSLNFSRLLFGDAAEKYLNDAMTWYEKLAPILLEGDVEDEQVVRSLGRNIHFPGVEPLPDFLVRYSKASIVLDNGVFIAELQDITHQQDILGRPLSLHLTGEELKELAMFSLDGIFDRRKKDETKDILELKLEGIQLSGVKLLSLKGKAIRLEEAHVALDAKAIYYQSSLDLSSQIQFSDAEFVGGSEKGIGKQLGLALANIKQFNLDASVSGALDDLDINLKSNLDKKVGDAIAVRIKQKQKELEKNLEKKINAKLADSLKKNNINSGKFNIDVNNLSASLDKNKAQLEGMLKNKLADYEAQKKRELEAKKAAEKQRLKRKADKELKDKLKELKLKF